MYFVVKRWSPTACSCTCTLLSSVLWTELVVHVHVLLHKVGEKITILHDTINYCKPYIFLFTFSIYLFILCCTDFNLQVNKNVKECLQIVLENVDDNWNLVYEDGEMKVWAALNF